MRRVFLAAVAAMCLSAPAGAVILGISPAEFSPDVFATTPTGAVLATIGPSTFVSSGGPGDFVGHYTETAISDPGNVFGAGDVTILVNITSTAGANDIGRVTASDFGAFGLVDVGYVLGLGNTPTTVDRTTGGPVGFNFVDQIAAGDSTDTLVIETPGRFVAPGGLSMINDHTSDNPGLSAAVPELSTWVMALLGFGMLAFAARAKARHPHTIFG